MMSTWDFDRYLQSRRCSGTMAKTEIVLESIIPVELVKVGAVHMQYVLDRKMLVVRHLARMNSFVLSLCWGIALSLGMKLEL